MKAICEKHGEYEAETVKILGQEIVSNCPICEKEYEDQEAKEMAAVQDAARLERLRRRGIEPEFENASLENFIPENETEKKALEAARDLAAGKIKKVILLGQNGVGKTHLACALALLLDGIVLTPFQISNRVRAGFNKGLVDTDVLDEILTFPFVALDEIGRTKGSDAEKNWFSYLVDKAHTRGILLLFISNRQRASNLPQERRGEAFEYFFDNDVISRLRQNSRIVEVRGRDRRAGA